MAQEIKIQEQLERVRNDYGFWVNKACMSCQHRVIIEGTRYCELNQRVVSARALCPEWQMSDGMKNAGLENGGEFRLRVRKQS